MKRTLEDLSRGAALLASIAGIVTLLQFNRGQDFEKEKLALEMFRDYSKDKREFDSSKAPSEADTRAFAVTTQYAAETIYRFRRGNPGWEETVMGMIKDNESALLFGQGMALPGHGSPVLLRDAASAQGPVGLRRGSDLSLAMPRPSEDPRAAP